MAAIVVRCPNCGAPAQRHLLPLLAQSRTECHRCDYLLVTCTRTGKVVEAHAPGLSAATLRQHLTEPLPVAIAARCSA